MLGQLCVHGVEHPECTRIGRSWLLSLPAGVGECESESLLVCRVCRRLSYPRRHMPKDGDADMDLPPALIRLPALLLQPPVECYHKLGY